MAMCVVNAQCYYLNSLGTIFTHFVRTKVKISKIKSNILYFLINEFPKSVNDTNVYNLTKFVIYLIEWIQVTVRYVLIIIIIRFVNFVYHGPYLNHLKKIW